MFIIVPFHATAQIETDSLITDSVPNTVADTLTIPADSLALQDPADSTALSEEQNDAVISSKIVYSASDSIVNDLVHKKVYLYGDAEIKYEDITLSAAQIDYDFDSYTVHAVGVKDTADNWVGLPDFKQGSQAFTSHEINYNFRSKKAYVRQVQTEVIEGTLTGSEVKTMDDNSVIYVRHGEYCPCEDPNAKTRFKIGKLKVIKDEQIVTGPGYMVIGKVPTPLAFPFGFFPNTEDKQAGLIFPSYGNGEDRGYFLNDLGFYLPVGDTWDTKFLADIYTRGSWGLKNETNYKKRYKYNGGFGVEFNKIVTGDRDLNNYSAQNQFFIRWDHKQDRKARPNSNFAASVNAGSTQNFRNNINASQDNYLTNTFRSSITYDKGFYNSPWSFSLKAGHEQNSRTGNFTFTLPQMSINRSRTMPLDGLFNDNPNQAFYEKLGLSYSSTLSNELKTTESEIALNNLDNLKDQFRNGMRHNIGVTLPLNAGPVTITPSFSYRERWYLKTFGRTFNDDLNMYERDTIRGFDRNFDYNFSTSMTTKLYGMFSFRNGPFEAIRHTLTPNLSYTVSPSFDSRIYGFYDEQGELTSYSPYDGTLYGAPPSGRSEQMRFSLANNLEAKVLSKRDTTSKYKKISLIDNFTVSTSYDFAKDSLNLSPISMSMRTKVTKYADFNASASFEPYTYAVDENQDIRNTNVFLVNSSGRVMSFERGQIAINGKGFGSEMYTKSGGGGDVVLEGEETDSLNTDPILKNKGGMFENFTVPWHFSFGYKLSANRGRGAIELPEGNAIVDSIDIVQSIIFNGDFKLFNKVAVNVSSGYDFEQNQLTPMTINMRVDLNCWELSARVIPYGERRSYSLRLNIKSSMLRDLKLEQKGSLNSDQGFYF